jgi:transcriptional regulator with XRE-family HTH domain
LHQKGLTLKQVSERFGVIYITARSYASRREMTTVDFTAIAN